MKNKNTFQKISFSLLLIVYVFTPFLAKALPSLDEQLSDVREQIEQEKYKLNEAKQKEATLSSEITNLNTKILSMSNSISDLEKEISNLNKNIGGLTNEIDKANINIVNKRDNLKQLIKLLYEKGNISTVEVLASTDSITDFLNQEEYNRAVQNKISNVISEVKALKIELELKKGMLSESKKKTETAKANLESQKQQLWLQTNNKNYLLNETRGDETEYKRLIDKLRAQEKKLESSIWGGAGNYVSIGHVNQGDIVGYIGNSGYSSGPHLHFEIRNYSQNHVNPANYIGNGYFIHPAPGATISQTYGPADWGGWSPYSFHTGIDYRDGGRGLPVRASAEGDIIKRITGQSNTYPKGPLSYGNYVMIKHSNDMFTLYGHLR